MPGPIAPGPERSSVDAALLEVQLALERAQDVVVDGSLGPHSQERLARRIDDRALDLAVLDDLPVVLAGARRIALPLDVLGAMLVHLAEPVEQRPVAGPHRVELVDAPRGGLDHLLARDRLLFARLGVGAEPESSDQPRQGQPLAE